MTAPRAGATGCARSACSRWQACRAGGARRSRPAGGWRRGRRGRGQSRRPRRSLGERDQPRTRKFSAARACAQAEPSTPRPRTATVRSRASGGADARAPDAVLAVDMRVHAEVVAQDVARHPLDHALGQALVDHPGQRHLQRRVACHVLDPGPEVQDRLEPREGREIRQAAVGRIDDVVDVLRRGVGRQCARAEARVVQRGAQRAAYWSQRSVFAAKRMTGASCRAWTGPGLGRRPERLSAPVRASV
jgi:hypothetical protein